MILALASLLFAIEFTPPIPRSDQRVTAHVTTDWSGYSCDPASIETKRTGSDITIEITAPASPGCNSVLPVIVTRTFDAEFGPLPPGVYDVTARVIHPQTTHTLPSRTLHVRDADAPFRVEPEVLIGTNEFLIEFPNDAFRCDPAALCPVLVTAGGRTAIVTVLDTRRVLARVDLPEGTHDVSVTVNGRQFVARAALTVAMHPDEALLERILVPVLTQGPGALGSFWTTDLWLHNANVYDVNTSLALLQNDTTAHIDAEPTRNFPRGYWLTLPRGSGEGVSITAFVRDASQDVGTELPIVREDDFRTKRFSLVRVPMGSNVRTTLRIYALRERTQLGMRIFDENDRLVLEQSLGTGPLAYVVPDLARYHPRLQNLTAARIELTGNGIWAFASITSNATQHVTIVRPQ